MPHTVVYDFTVRPEPDPWQLRQLAQRRRETADPQSLTIPEFPADPNLLDDFEKHRKL